MTGVLQMQINNSLIIQYSPFDRESRVYICKENEQTVASIQSDLNKLAEEIVGLAYGQNSFNVIIQAPPAITDEMSKRVKDIEQAMYSENKIQLQGM